VNQGIWRVLEWILFPPAAGNLGGSVIESEGSMGPGVRRPVPQPPLCP